MSQKKFFGSKGYQLFKHYVRFLNEHLMFRMIYEGKENIPPMGEMCILASNHQNCANDPLNLLLGLENETHPYVLARSDAFELPVPGIRPFFYWLGMLPAFRAEFGNGPEAAAKNEETMRIVYDKVLDGNRLIIYPAGIHHDKHWFDEFTSGYTHMAFTAAKMADFKKEFYILPCANHYEDYYEVGAQVIIRYGKPVPLSPFYEMYQTKPRTAQREVNKLVRAQIEDMILDVRDLEHYDQIDWLRDSAFGIDHCRAMGLNPAWLPDKLESDRKLVATIAERGWTDAEWNAIDAVRQKEARLGIAERDIMNRKGWGVTLLSLLAQLLLLPLWLVSLYPNIIHYNIHRPFVKKDRLFTNSVRFIVPTVFGIPLFFIGTVLVCGLAWGWWWQSAVWMLLASFPLAWFALHEWQWMKKTWRNLRVLRSEKIKELWSEREQLFAYLKTKI
jgi:hypothetical protein